MSDTKKDYEAACVHLVGAIRAHVEAQETAIAKLEAELAAVKAERDQMQEAIQIAYLHLDYYGVISSENEAELESQRKVFDRLRPFFRQPKEQL